MKLLIVEDSKALAKIISIKIYKSLKLDIDIAETLKEAHELTKQKDYDIALLDLHLPDAEGEEVVDCFIQKNIPSIVMTSSLDRDLQKSMSKKGIIDYVLKDRSESIDYITARIDRVLKNRLHTALIVDDSEFYRKQMQKILATQFISSITAKDGTEALELIKENPKITFMLTDYHMPNINGVELVIATRKIHKKDTFPIIGLSSEDNNSIEFLKYGVNDFIKKPFFNEELSTRINNSLEALENIQKLHSIANTDFLTQVSTRKHFYAEMHNYNQQSQKEKRPFALAMLDIDYFKKINDTYGHDVGDKVIRLLAQTIKDNIKGRDIVSRFGGEEFCIVLKDIPKEPAVNFFNSLREKISNLSINIDEHTKISFTVSIGVATTCYGNLEDMIGKSDKYLYKAKEAGRNQVYSDLEF